MRVGVVGSRSFLATSDNIELVKYHILSTISIDNIEYLVSGGAMGADYCADRAAQQLGIGILIHYPRWELGNNAGYLRNSKIVDSSDIVIAFWDGKSRGTKHTIDLCKERGKKVIVIDISERITS